MSGRLRVRIVDDLKALDDARLDEICADGHAFANRRWFRLMDSIDLSVVVGGRPRLRYALVKLDHRPIAVCPLLRVRGNGAYFVYSLRQYYFEHWLDEAARMDPTGRARLAKLFRAVSFYRRILEGIGAELDDCLLVCNPLSYRCETAIAPDPGVPRAAIYSAILSAFLRMSRRTRLPLRFLGVEGEAVGEGAANESAGWHSTLVAAGCTRSFLFHDNAVDLSAFEDFDDYLHSFSRTTRRAFQRDERRTAEANIAFRFVDDWSRMADRLADLYERTYGKYGASHFRHDAAFWQAVQSNLGSHAEMLLAERHDELVGFTMLLHNERRGESWTYRIGRLEANGLADVPFYFGLSFYWPIRRAIERGYDRIWLGPASYEAKAVRGARHVPLYNYHWSPRRLDRWLLHPYFAAFGDESRKRIERAPSTERRANSALETRTPIDSRPN